MDSHRVKLDGPDKDGYVWHEGDFPKWGVMPLSLGRGRICWWDCSTGYDDFY